VFLCSHHLIASLLASKLDALHAVGAMLPCVVTGSFGLIHASPLHVAFQTRRFYWKCFITPANKKLRLSTSANLQPYSTPCLPLYFVSHINHKSTLIACLHFSPQMLT
jgi:hypothetical protein